MDFLYNTIKKERDNYDFLKHIVPVVGNVWDSVYIKEKNGSKRMKADLVISFKMTKCLLLKQGMNIDVMFETFMNYTAKHILLDFEEISDIQMQTAGFYVPKYYSLEWFITHMKKFFNVEKTEEIEKNRYMMLGSIL